MAICVPAGAANVNLPSFPVWPTISLSTLTFAPAAAVWSAAVTVTVTVAV